jgi:hypothetical protein
MNYRKVLEGVKKCKKSGKVFVPSLLMDSASKKVIRTATEYLA